MTSWAARMHRRAATFSNVVTSCGHPSGPYPRRLEKVKFGVPLEEVCKNDIPGPLLVLILKLNKEAPFRKDVFRAPGHQGAMKKLIHFLQTGRLVNMDNFSVYTIASVLKKFLRKIPGGVFGREIEQQLFQIIEMSDVQEQRDEIYKIIMSLPVYTQRLLVLLFGTFRVIASNSERAGTGMSSEALGVSVAPSFFQSCVSDGKTAKMEDVLRFKVATRVMKHLIEEFASSDLFGRDNYEFYARVTGRVLRVQGEWICSFQYPPPPPRGNSAQQLYANNDFPHFASSPVPDFQNLQSLCVKPATIMFLPNDQLHIYSHVHEILYDTQLSLEAEKTWLQCECARWHMKYNLEAMGQQDECQSTPALMESGGLPSQAVTSTSLGMIPEHTLLESCTRLSISLEQNGLFKAGTGPSSRSSSASRSSTSGAAAAGGTAPVALLRMTLDELRDVNRYAESTKSLSYLPLVHERQTARMRTRSEWFLSPTVECTSCGGSIASDVSEVVLAARELLRRSSSGTIVGAVGLSLSAESVQRRPSVRRSNSRDKRYYLHRSGSRRNKENGCCSRTGSFKTKKDSISRTNSYKAATSVVERRGSGSFKLKSASRSTSFKSTGELCTCITPAPAEPPKVEEAAAVSAENPARDPSAPAVQIQTIHVTLTYKPRI